MFELESLVRDNIKTLTPYSSARNEYRGKALALLDANESGFRSPLDRPLNRYPDPSQLKVRKKIGELNNLRSEQIFVGNGSDQAIDLLIRVFCRPGTDNVIVCPPTYGMYEIAAAINDVDVSRVNLTRKFELDLKAIKEAASKCSKLIFICSPNNPTGNLLDREAILDLARLFHGLVVVDEAYLQYSGSSSFATEINKFPNLVVLQTFSKAWGLADLRIGTAFANPAVIGYIDRVKPPYNLSQNTQDLLLTALGRMPRVARTTKTTILERDLLAASLRTFSFVQKVFPSNANFLLIKVTGSRDLYSFLLSRKIVVRRRDQLPFCKDCLRISVGSPRENRTLIEALHEYEKGFIY